MARRRKQSDAAVILTAIVIAIIIAALASMYVLSYLVVFFFAIMFIHYCLLKSSRTQDYLPEMNEAYVSYYKVQNEKQLQLNSFSNLNVISSGTRYDERNPRAKYANQVLYDLNEALEEKLNRFNGAVARINRVHFYKYAFATYGFILLLYKIFPDYFPMYNGMSSAPVIAAIGSIVAGLQAAKIQGFSIHNFKSKIESNKFDAPTNGKYFAGALGFLGCLIALQLASTGLPALYTTFKNSADTHTASSSYQNNTHSTNESLIRNNSDQANPIVSNDISTNPSSEDYTTDSGESSNSENDLFILITPTDGFVTKNVNVRDSSSVNANILFTLKSGGEVKVIGKSLDKKWYIIENKNSSGDKEKGYISASLVALFSP